MEAIAVAILGGAIAAIGYLARRVIERSGETERLQRQALTLDMERQRRGFRAEDTTVQVLVLILPRE